MRPSCRAALNIMHLLGEAEGLAVHLLRPASPPWSKLRETCYTYPAQTDLVRI
jgi:hypothetical protein